ncbi:MFS transporter [Spirochaeta isovalerica]|uniref:Fucose permease n=1 Tax=Spirochaeta isovalerica TaxID=150 RepID=A0A841RB76_9SPIO|nr:MFS transporter [Spirochaeta isovalerica]MBB6481183.1 fucose permease [Spirochaeta isovalerica]
MNIQNKVIVRTDWASRLNLLIYSSSTFIIPISLVMIKEELGLTFTQAGTLSFIPSILQFLVLLASSLFASRFHKIPLIRTAVIISGLSLIVFSTVNSYMTALAVLLSLSFAGGFHEALLTPLCEDLHPGDSGKKMNQLHAFWPIGTLISVLLIGELLSRGISWRAPFIVLGILFLTLTVIYPSNKYVPFKPSGAHLKELWLILKTPVFWFMGMALFFAGGAEGGFSYWTASYIQLEFGTLPRSGGFGLASFALGMIIGRLTAAKAADRLGLGKILVISSLLSLLFGLIFVKIANIYLLFLFMVFMGFSMAPLWPSIQSYAAKRIPIDPTMMMILLSCFGVPGFSTATLLMGVIGDYAGLRVAFIVAPAYLVLLLIMFSITFLLLKKAGNR